MAQVYIHLPKVEAEQAVTCGMKLSDKKILEFKFAGINYNCFFGWLNPNDDVECRGDAGYSCVCLNIEDRYCFVGNLDLYPSDLYFKTLLPFNKYVLGKFRLPRCMVCCTVLPSRATIQGRRLDFPLMYENSQELYLENMQSLLEGKFDSFKNDQLVGFFELLAGDGRFQKIVKDDVIIFVGDDDEIFTFRKPEITGYQLKGL